MNTALLISLAGALGLLLMAIVRVKIHPFLALTVVSLLFGIGAGLGPVDAADVFLQGFGDTMKWIGVVMVLGTLIGELLNQSGGTLRIADTILTAVGKRRLPLAMVMTGYVVSIPAFVDVAYIMLKPVVEILAVKSRRNILVVGLSLTAGLTATHALLPPTPGPLSAAGILKADLGRVILLNTVVAACAAAGGLLWATLYCRRVEIPYDRELRETLSKETNELEVDTAGAWKRLAAFLPILLPLVLIALAAFLSKNWTSWPVELLRFLGTPVVALLVGMTAAVLLLRTAGRLETLNLLVERSIQRAAVVLLITGAGGGFGAVIKGAGVGEAVQAAFAEIHLPSLLFPFLLAMALTTATGSLTVSMVTSSSVVASMLGSLGLSPEMAVALIGAGSLCVIHANSSFFWLLSRLHQVRPEVLYRTYSVQSLCMGLGGLLGALALWLCGVR